MLWKSVGLSTFGYSDTDSSDSEVTDSLDSDTDSSDSEVTVSSTLSELKNHKEWLLNRVPRGI